MAYSNLPIGTANPCLIMILVDQSSSMEAMNGTEKKSVLAADAVNRALYEIILSCQAGGRVKDRCFIGVVGYGEKVNAILGDMISKVAENPIAVKKVKKKEPDGAGGLVELEVEMPIWLKPTAANGTPMAEAFAAAAVVIQEWIKTNPSSFPPVVINITDGEPNDTKQGFVETKAAAKKLTDLRTADGNVLLLNAHISDANAGEHRLPATENGLNDNYAKFLFNISSVLPEPLFKSAEQVGFAPQSGAHGFVFNAGAETMIKLLSFGSMGTLR